MLSPSLVNGRKTPVEAFKNKIRASLKRRDQDDDFGNWEKRLEKNGFGVKSIEKKYNISKEKEESSGPSIEYFLKYDTKLRLTLVYDCDASAYYSEIAFNHDLSRNGEAPLDYAGLSWNGGEWFLEGNTLSEQVETSGYVYADDDADGSFSGSGAAFEVYDGAISQRGSDSKYYYGGVYLRTADDDVNAEDRGIWGAYTHTWNDVDITGVSVGMPKSLSVSVSNVDYKWRSAYNHGGDGTYLRVFESDADLQNCGGVQ